MRTIEEIYNEIIAEKESQTALEGLLPGDEDYSGLLEDITSSSKVAIWRLWAFLTAVTVWVHEQVYDVFKSEVQAIADSAPPGTPGWYQKKILEFQYGDALVYDQFQYGYAVIDESKKIITRCAVEERSDGAVLIKVAKGDVTPEPLDFTEKSAVESYAAKIKFAGTRLAVASLAADVLDLEYDIYYDPLITLATIQDDLQAALDGFKLSVPFNGEVRITRITDVLQDVTGVVDPVFKAASGTPDGGSLVPVAIRYFPASGYFEYADTVNVMFNFIPQL
jgi:hypothetical protein